MRVYVFACVCNVARWRRPIATEGSPISVVITTVNIVNACKSALNVGTNIID